MEEKDTRMLNDSATVNDNGGKSPDGEKNKKGKEHGKYAAEVAASIGIGFAAGAATGFVSNGSEMDVAEDEKNIAEDGDLKVAHPTANTFSEAFAQARAEVGPGGIFEFKGNIHSTYYAEEWESMSAEDKADFQHQVNEYAADHPVTPHAGTTVSQTGSTTSQETVSHDTLSHESGSHEDTHSHQNEGTTDQHSTLEVSQEQEESGIRVLGVEAVEMAEGNIMNVATVTVDGEAMLLVDVDNNGTIDIMVHDDNHDGQISQDEYHDISDAGFTIHDLANIQQQQDMTVYEAGLNIDTNDDLPDYINDADASMMV